MTVIQQLLELYKENTAIRALIQILPNGIGGAADILLTEAFNSMMSKRSKALFDELARGDTIISENVINSEEFLHKFFVTTQYALNTRRTEKIQMFARLLKSSVVEDDLDDVDEFEDFIKILDELSYRECIALQILDQYDKNPRPDVQNDCQWTRVFWGEYIEKLQTNIQLTKEESSSFFERLVRTGCYQLFEGKFWVDDPQGEGFLTPTYHRLKKYVRDIKLSE